jgi:hypothetical protein
MNLIALAPTSCAVAASILAYQGKDGWGWFLFVAVLTAGAASEWKPSSKKD